MPSGAFVDKGTGTVVARMVGLSSEMTAFCHPVLLAAKALAATHIKTGNYEASFGIDKIPGKKGVVDRAIYNSDPQAHIIEDGHLQYGKTDSGQVTVRWVEGLHIMRRAAQTAGRL